MWLDNQTNSHQQAHDRYRWFRRVDETPFGRELVARINSQRAELNELKDSVDRLLAIRSALSQFTDAQLATIPAGAPLEWVEEFIAEQES